jgi:hypothetical protein
MHATPMFLACIAAAGNRVAWHGCHVHAGNTPGEANINLGRQVISAHTGSLGARAVAGSGVMHTAEEGATVSANIMLLTPRKIVDQGSVAFTDRAHNSAAVAGMGNGPVAIARANEVASMARAERDMVIVGAQRADWNNRHLLLLKPGRPAHAQTSTAAAAATATLGAAAAGAVIVVAAAAATVSAAARLYTRHSKQSPWWQ